MGDGGGHGAGDTGDHGGHETGDMGLGTWRMAGDMGLGTQGMVGDTGQGTWDHGGHEAGDMGLGTQRMVRDMGQGTQGRWLRRWWQAAPEECSQSLCKDFCTLVLYRRRRHTPPPLPRLNQQVCSELWPA